MAKPSIPARKAGRLFHAAAWAAWFVFGALIAINLGFFVLHAAQVLRYPFPLDYGEGPLLAQVTLLRSGASLRQLYGPIAAPPHLVVNYPPVYLLTTLAISYATGTVLLAGRLVSLAATLLCVGALIVLTTDDRRPTTARNAGGRLLIPLAFLAIPIVREWAVLMRVDMLGVAFGLWGLAVLRAEFRVQSSGFRVSGALILSAVLLVLSLFTKPSLLAAPLAALVALLMFDWRRALVLAGVLATFGGICFGLLAYDSNFFEHVVVANANQWQAVLAEHFWRQVATIHWPLLLAAAIGAALAARRWPGRAGIPVWFLPLVYSLGGAATALGVGKVGAYLNYFLELYVGLIWLAARGAEFRVLNSEFRIQNFAPLLVRFTALALLALSLVHYYPMWSETTTKLAGVIEGKNPPRLIIGQRGVWQDLRRERQILQTMARTNQALVEQVRAANEQILTDVPGVAAQAGQVGRLQAFEHSQIGQLWNQRDLRIDLLNGDVPLVVLDYLGNWLSPDVIALVTHRYGQEGSRGTYDLYRPLDPGPAQALDLHWDGGLRLAAIHGIERAYHGGELLPITLLWQAEQGATFHARHSTVLLALRNGDGDTVASSVLPFTYGAISTDEIPTSGVQHMQTLGLPANSVPGNYMLSVAIEAAGTPTIAQDVAIVKVESQIGAMLANGWMEAGTQEYIPAPLLAFWQQLGGKIRLGSPISPVVPFVGFTQQCFERGCLRFERGEVVQAPIGRWLAAGDVGANGMFDQPTISAAFQSFYQEHGGTASLGMAVTNEFRSGDRIVQYTEFARLERPLSSGEASFGNIGEDLLRLPGGTRYRWP